MLVHVLCDDDDDDNYHHHHLIIIIIIIMLCEQPEADTRRGTHGTVSSHVMCAQATLRRTGQGYTCDRGAARAGWV